ncbi:MULTISPECIES: class I SAM-dependent methyltransferase [unclassified Pseudomonas]|uniref:class I SAM-dependent methyltransferase n=1 Tax=unclassified Pseudomonas TaxID=196821 RepID=UPI0025CBDBA3|nr:MULTISPECIES: class I SAM-dependent methyltransferase [unclassified Pseudomonas]
MLLNSPPSYVTSVDPADEDYARQYSTDFVSRWDELIDWDKRAAGEGHFFIDLLLQAGACRVFDASTGSGFHAAQLRKACFDVTACDGSATMVERARANFERLGVKIRLYQSDWADLHHLQLTHGLRPFDAVLCLGSSLCHIFDRDKRIEALRCFRRLLKPGGMLLIDQRNFRAILAGHFSSSGQYYYCGKTAKVTIGALSESLCEFVYTFAEGARYRLRVFPLLPVHLRSELMAAGFTAVESFGDFKRIYDPMRADFIIHQAIA